MIKTTQEAISSAKIRLVKHSKDFDDEGYHVTFDKLLEDRLEELDPEFIREMKNTYKESNMSRWYA